MIIPTKDQQGNPNGYLHLLWNANEQPDYRPDQVYLTVIAPGCCKGPHLHRKRRGWFHVIKGEVVIRQKVLAPIDLFGGWRTLGTEYVDIRVRSGDGPVVIPQHIPACLYNAGLSEAWVINMPSPAYDPNDPDEHVPENWQHPDWWLKIQEGR